MNKLEEKILDLLWSLWSELGIPGPKRLHQNASIDPEPLIVWTPFLAAHDPRLLGLVFDWCIANETHVSKKRFTGLLKNIPLEAASSFAAFNGALSKHGVQWQPQNNVANLQQGRTKIHLPIERPSLIRFRLRALCGSPIKAEVFIALIKTGDTPLQTSEIIPAGFTRRSTERAVEELAAANLIEVTNNIRPKVFRLRHHNSLKIFINGRGLRWIDWHQALSLIAHLMGLIKLTSKDMGILRVETAKVWQPISKLSMKLNLESLKGSPEQPDAHEKLIDWGMRAIENL
ncbi:MAG: hypothetical protein JW841_00640 [Deltaproteobacteria bacterium]|nr:hypothetical protein [Deltaproteobacteria bacterium]